MIDAERRRVLEIRRSGTVPSEVVADVLAMLDVEESMLDSARAARADIGQHTHSVRRSGETCEDLERHPAIETAPGPVCARCLEDGTDWVAMRQCLALRARRVLRLLARAPRHRALPRRPAPGHAVRGARRGLALVLRAPHHRLSGLPAQERSASSMVRAGRPVTRSTSGLTRAQDPSAIAV